MSICHGPRFDIDVVIVFVHYVCNLHAATKNSLAWYVLDRLMRLRLAYR